MRSTCSNTKEEEHLLREKQQQQKNAQCHSTATGEKGGTKKQELVENRHIFFLPDSIPGGGPPLLSVVFFFFLFNGFWEEKEKRSPSRPFTTPQRCYDGSERAYYLQSAVGSRPNQLLHSWVRERITTNKQRISSVFFFQTILLATVFVLCRVECVHNNT